MSAYNEWDDACYIPNFDTLFKRHGDAYKKLVIKEKKVFTKEQLEKNKFYIGSNSIFTRGNGWGHSNIEAAIEHAQSMLSEKEGTDAVFIVQIVKVVKRKPINVIIEDV